MIGRQPQRLRCQPVADPDHLAAVILGNDAQHPVGLAIVAVHALTGLDVFDAAHAALFTPLWSPRSRGDGFSLPANGEGWGRAP
jgi:hypothetical protein